MRENEGVMMARHIRLLPVCRRFWEFW